MTREEFVFFNPTKVNFIPSGIIDLRKYSYTRRPLVIISESVLKSFDKLSDNFPEEAIIITRTGSNPDFQDVETIKIPDDCTQIIGVGGGSTLDVAKACFAKMLTGLKFSLKELIRSSEIMDEYKTKRASFKLVLVPTTFGTSSEFTMWGTLWDWGKKIKCSISHEVLYADHAVICPEFCVRLTRDIAASAGLDTISHCIESLWNKRSNFMTKAYSIEALRLSVNTLSNLLGDLGSSEYIQNQAKATVLAGLAFSQTSTAGAHSLSYPLTIHHNVPHGIAASLTLGTMFKFNYPKAKTELEEVLLIFQERYGTPSSTFDECYLRFLEDCKVPHHLKDYGVTPADVSKLVSEAFYPDRLNNMVHTLSKKEIQEIYEAII